MAPTANAVAISGPNHVGVVLVAKNPEWYDKQLLQLQDAGFHLALIHKGDIRPPKAWVCT